MHRFAQFDSEGTIVGLVEMEELPEGVPEPVLPTDQHDVAELDPDDEEIRKLPTEEIIHRYRIDPDTKQLVKKKKKK